MERLYCLPELRSRITRQSNRLLALLTVPSEKRYRQFLLSCFKKLFKRALKYQLRAGCEIVEHGPDP